MILILVEDLLFLSKIEQTARQVGVALEAVGPQAAAERAAQGVVSGVIVDLNHRSGSALGVAQALKINPSTRQLTVVGFLSHIQTDLARSAREAGCDLVLPRSAFSQRLPRLLEELAGKGSVGASRS
jgi:CheY-like chemotaxis protein